MPSGQDVAMLDTARFFDVPVRFGTERGCCSLLTISQDLLLAMSLLDVVDVLSVIKRKTRNSFLLEKKKKKNQRITNNGITSYTYLDSNYRYLCTFGGSVEPKEI